ncbi:neural cell adhesion molecule L1-like isoform X1 [Argiope bruennichi]|uniref:neural cell adhesion molecule L1-like isoform X1 n=1 Tax=Argiope bruennichi TaxID=94029 RepID=UPI0024947737|nr:neural cell adhesion molecule L1-like isoform X1 [Argiope bruennichi]
MALSEYFRFRSFTSLLFIYFSLLKNIDNSHAYINALSPFVSVIKADVGSQLILPCNVSGRQRPRISWLKNGRLLLANSTKDHPKVDHNALLFYNLLPSDTGNYTCIVNNLYDLKEYTIELYVKTPPGKLKNVTVHPSTVVATVRWHVDNDGGYPITNFTLLYRPTKANASESWHMPQPVHVSPAVRQFFIYQLRPGTDYIFKIWATNKLGPGEAVTVRASTCKPVDPPEVFGKMLADAENFGSTAWLLAVCMLAATVLTLSLISFALLFKDDRNGAPEEGMPHIITNPGFEIDLEQYYLLEHADFNDNIEKPVGLNNNTVVLPSRV